MSKFSLFETNTVGVMVLVVKAIIGKLKTLKRYFSSVNTGKKELGV